MVKMIPADSKNSELCAELSVPDAENQRAIFLAVLWEKARPFESEIREAIAKRFQLLAETEIFWPRRSFVRNLKAFYGFGSRFTWWNKARKCGYGAFKVFIFENLGPSWEMGRTSFGRLIRLDKVVDSAKHEWRHLTHHSNRVHASLNREETENEARILFGQSIKAWLEKRAKWSLPNVGDLENFFKSGELVRIGDGSRRICYRIPGTELCVKSYRGEKELNTRLRPDGTLEMHKLKDSVLSEIRTSRFSNQLNTSCQEWYYHQELCQRTDAALCAVFPDLVERILLPSRGWCLIENVVVNEDGSHPCRFSHVYRESDAEMKAKLLSAFKKLIDELTFFAVRFYDPQNVLVQKTADGFRLRIVDFEPAARTFIALDRLAPVFVRMKVRRRAKRYLVCHLGVSSHV